MSDPLLLLISRDDILEAGKDSAGKRFFRRLARLTHLGIQLVATAPQPDRWSSQSSDPDSIMASTVTINNRLADAGGELDGVYYVARSSLTQRRNREEALLDILARYATRPCNCYLFSSSKKFVKAAGNLGINATALGGDNPLMKELRELRKQIVNREKVGG